MEKEIFLYSINRVNRFLKFSGIDIRETDLSKTLLQRFKSRWFYCLCLFWMNRDAQLFFGTITHISLIQITLMIPCITLCNLGNFKSFFFIKYHHHVVNLIKTLTTLQDLKPIDGELLKYLRDIRQPFLYRINDLMIILDFFGVCGFFVTPVVASLYHYMKTNEIQLFLPFITIYPFDAYDPNYWPIAFLWQFGSAWVAVFLVYGTDIFYCTICVFIHMQFMSLKEDLLHIETFLRNPDRRSFAMLVHRHREIIRCVNMLQTIYGISTLFNAISSSLIICINGFNTIILKDLLMMAPFTPFLLYGGVQIYIFCYYGDLIMRDSTEISEAIYKSKWYELDASSMKYCLFMLMRAQKPCKITAHGFTDINMGAFTRILSSAWSYFTLLTTMYTSK